MHAILRHARSISLALGVLAALVGAAPASPGAARYVRYRLYELAALSDVIVSGEIRVLDELEFELRVDDIVLGEPMRALRVRRFQDWTCAGRWTEYAVGQRVLLFLRRSSEQPDSLFILGAGGEGEMPLHQERVIVGNAHDYRVRGYELAEHEVAGDTLTGSAVPYAELTTAVRGFREACAWRVSTVTRKLESIGPRIEIEALETYTRGSATALHLVDEARSSAIWSGPQPPGPQRLDARALRGIDSARRGFTGNMQLRAVHESSHASDTISRSFGASSTWIGDVDGDGAQDLAIGAPKDSRAGDTHGAVWLSFLNENGEPRAVAELVLRLPSSETSGGSYPQLGAALAPLGDLDADGVPDLAVGAPWWSDGKQLGAVHLVFLQRDGDIARAIELGAQDALRAAGIGAHSGIGKALALLGDLDGDGTVELAIGQDPSDVHAAISGAKPPWKLDRSVLIASLERDGTARRVRRIGGRELGLELTYGQFGHALAAIGDVDGNGVNDLAIGDGFDNDGGSNRGAVWIAFLARDGSVVAKQKISDWVGGFTGFLRDDVGFGDALAGPGDLDGDGVPDLVVGSAGTLWTLLLRRDGTVREHRQLAIEASETPASAAFGRSLSCTIGKPGGDSAQFAVHGWRRRARDSESVLWWLRANADGTLAAW